MASRSLSAKFPTVVPTEAELEELGKSLTTREIPAKLRCGICDLIAYNTIRLPCCSTNICENCFKTELPDDSEECVLCHHSPLDKSICTANKSMRTTIRALLKNKFDTRMKRQAAEAAKAVKEEEAVGGTPGEAISGKEDGVSDEKDEEYGGDAVQVRQNEPTALHMEKSVSARSHGSAGSRRGEKQTLPESTEPYVPNKPDAASLGDGIKEKEGPPKNRDFDESKIGEDVNQWAAGSSTSQGLPNGAVGLNGMNHMNSTFPMDFNSMMSGGGMMPMSGFPNMMGMGMMPSMMSQMFGGFDGSNMGMNMNAMNMGMGLNGQNQFGSPWMAGQDSYNNNSFGNGSFGNQGGYNMSGNNNQMNDQSYANNDFQRGHGRQGFQNRRGRRGYYNGGYGRNNYNQSYQGNQRGYANHNGPTQNLYPHSQNEQLTNQNFESTTEGQPAQSSMTAAEAEAQMMKELAPGGQHDFDEELGRKPSVDEDSKNAWVDTENADSSISPNSKETLPTEATVEQDVKANDGSESIVHDEQQDCGKMILPDESFATVEKSANTVPSETERQQQHSEAQGLEDLGEVADPTPRPIQTFISDEPRSRNVMPPPASTTSVGPASQFPGRVQSHSHGGRTPSDASQNTDIAVAEPKAVGVVGAPTGPRALRQGLRNTGRSGWGLAGSDKPIIPEPVGSDARGRSRSRSPIHNQEVSHSCSSSRSPAPRHMNNHGSKHHAFTSEPSESRREERHDDRRNGKREERREERRHRRSHRYEEEDAIEAPDTKRSSHRSHRRHDQETDHSERHRHRARSQSRSPDRDWEPDRTVVKEKHRHREDTYKGERKHRRKRSRSQEYSVDPTPTTPYAHELTDDYDGHNSRKRRDRDYGQEDERERHERKRSRRGHSPNYETVSDRHSRSHESSKPQTPITPSFHGPSSASRRGSMAINGTSQVQVPVLAKPIPTGPRASMQQSRPVERAKEREREAPKAPANKAEKDVHTLEREARDRERLQREMQRRAFGAPKRKGDGTKQPSRRVSYKYEDEDGLDARRVEQEREAGRWR